MNTRLIIVWIFAVVLLLGIGLFGYVNRDLIAMDEVENYKPEETKQVNIKTCNLILDKGQATYMFQIDNDVIVKYSASYKTSVEDLDKYQITSNINNALSTDVNGITPVFSGGISDFSILINVDSMTYDKDKVGLSSEGLKKLNLIISDINNFEIFKSQIDAISLPFTCD